MNPCRCLGVFCFFLFSLHAYANGDLENVYCYSGNNSECSVLLEKNNEVDQVNYSVSLIDSVSGSKIFPESEMNSTMESVSLYKVNEKYALLKENFGNERSMELLTFRYIKDVLGNVRYYYFESSMNFKKRKKEWSGEQCDLKHNALPKSDEKSLLVRFSSICESKLTLPYNNSYAGNDMFFDIAKISDGMLKGNMTLVALDSKDTDSISTDDLGCKSNCELVINSADYIGKLNGKIRIKLHLDFEGDNATGYYYYDKIKENIKLVGKKSGDNINLTAYVKNGMELFNGQVNDGQFKGEWRNADRSKIYPFSLYLMLIQ